MEIGDYVRTDKGEIGKVSSIAKENLGFGDIEACNTEPYVYGTIIKSSPNIIDLIEVGDYVNGKKVIDTYTDYIFDYSEEFKVIRFSETDILHNTKHIKSILTKEIFEQMEYKVESKVN